MSPEIDWIQVCCEIYTVECIQKIVTLLDLN